MSASQEPLENAAELTDNSSSVDGAAMAGAAGSTGVSRDIRTASDEKTIGPRTRSQSASCGVGRSTYTYAASQLGK